MIQKTAKENTILWQQVEDEEGGIGEPALLIEEFMDVVTITQEDRYVNINYDSIDELCKVLKQAKKNNAGK